MASLQDLATMKARAFLDNSDRKNDLIDWEWLQGRMGEMEIEYDALAVLAILAERSAWRCTSSSLNGRTFADLRGHRGRLRKGQSGEAKRRGLRTERADRQREGFQQARRAAIQSCAWPLARLLFVDTVHSSDTRYPHLTNDLPVSSIS